MSEIPPRILVVDDEPLIAMMLVDWLAELGCAAIGPAESVAGALALIEDAAPDGAILDLSLGGEDSFSLAVVLRERGVPFTFATGHGAVPMPEAWGTVPILPKPFDFEAVKAMLARLLG